MLLAWSIRLWSDRDATDWWHLAHSDASGSFACQSASSGLYGRTYVFSSWALTSHLPRLPPCFIRLSSNPSTYLYESTYTVAENWSWLIVSHAIPSSPRNRLELMLWLHRAIPLFPCIFLISIPYTTPRLISHNRPSFLIIQQPTKEKTNGPDPRELSWINKIQNIERWLLWAGEVVQV